MILPRERDLRLVTVRRGGSLSDADHRALALWAATCAERVLPLFSAERPEDDRPTAALAAVRAWAGGDLPMMASRAAGGQSMGAARDLAGAPRFAAYAAGQAACVPHVPEHDLGAAAYALKAIRAAHGDEAVRSERAWQLDRVPRRLRALVEEDERRRDAICWGLFTL